MALGADRFAMLKMVLSQAFMLAIAGLVIGTGCAALFTRALKSLLFGVKPTDPLIFVIILFFLLAVTLLASYIPARRATKVEPVTALRCQ
jgi:ABC-type antimicrobial peptide transport system permease subunit